MNMSYSMSKIKLKNLCTYPWMIKCLKQVLENQKACTLYVLDKAIIIVVYIIAI